MRFLVVWLLLFSAPCFAGGPTSLRDFVSQAERRQAYVSALALGISSRCIAQQWGDNPPEALKEWFTLLLLSDLENRGKVMRGDMSSHQAAGEREALFFSLEQLQPTEFEAVADYASITPSQGFGIRLTKVFDCQYAALAKALGDVGRAM